MQRSVELAEPTHVAHLGLLCSEATVVGKLQADGGGLEKIPNGKIRVETEKWKLRKEFQRKNYCKKPGEARGGVGWEGGARAAFPFPDCKALTAL